MMSKERRKQRKKQLRINNQLKRDLYKDISIFPCCYCKKVFLITDLTIEHIIPISFGGLNDPSNIALACGPCNHQRGREAWFAKKQLLKESFHGR
jgi:5-methylcytosine-specific restriction endonuclease McrA